MTDTVQVSVKKAAWFEAGAWSIEVKEGEHAIWIYWKGEPTAMIRDDPKDGLAIDVAQELAVALHAALQSLPRQEQS